MGGRGSVGFGRVGGGTDSSCLTSGAGCGGNTPASLQLPLGVVAGVVLVELVRTGPGPVPEFCLSGLLWIAEQEFGAHL